MITNNQAHHTYLIFTFHSKQQVPREGHYFWTHAYKSQFTAISNKEKQTTDPIDKCENGKLYIKFFFLNCLSETLLQSLLKLLHHCFLIICSVSFLPNVVRAVICGIKLSNLHHACCCFFFKSFYLFYVYFTKVNQKIK